MRGHSLVLRYPQKINDSLWLARINSKADALSLFAPDVTAFVADVCDDDVFVQRFLANFHECL